MIRLREKCDRPLPDLENEPGNSILALLGLLVIVSLSIWLAGIWEQIPETVATAIDTSGNTREMGPKEEILILPALAAVFWAGFGLLARIPHKYNYPVRITPGNAQRQYALGVSLMSWMRLLVPLLLCFTAWSGTRASAPGPGAEVPAGEMALTLALMLTVAVHMALMIKGRGAATSRT